MGRLLLFDALATTFRTITLNRDPDCPMCGPHRSIHALIDYEAFCGMAKSHDADRGEVTASALAAERNANPNLVLIDVREPFEWEICHLDGATLIPMGELPNRLEELDKTKDVVAYCHTGRRSAFALQLLRDAGFAKARHLAGGIAAWSRDVDPSVPMY